MLKRYGVECFAKSEQFKEIILNRKIENGTLFWPNIGTKEKCIFDKIEKSIKHKIIRQYRIGNYWVDGYCKENNTVYEIYEEFHLKKSIKIKDKIRENIIKKKLHCRFIIIKVKNI